MVECGQLECYCRKEKSKGQAHGNQTHSPKREIVCLGGGVLKAKVKRSARTDKRRYSESHATEDDAAFVELLDSNSIYLSMIKQGALLYTERDQEKRWAEYFQEILDRGPVVVEVVEDIYISIKPPTEDEFVTAIKDLYNGKARWDTK